MKTAITKTTSSRTGQPVGARAFTLIEMVVVLGIIGILAALTLPSFTKAGKGNTTETATRKLMDDMAYARLKAMSSRTKVFVVFAPDLNWFTNWYAGGLTTQTNYLYTNAAANALIGGQLSSYVLFSPRSVGDQPGQSTPRYLTEWSSLPDGAFIPAAVFRNPNLFWNLPPVGANTYQIPLNDSAAAVSLPLPYIGFDENGRLLGRTANLAIPLVSGSILHSKDATGQTNTVINTDAVETEPPIPPAGGIVAGVVYLVTGPVGAQVRYPVGGTFYQLGNSFTGTVASANHTVLGGARVIPFHGIRLDWVTGRAKAVKPELP